MFRFRHCFLWVLLVLVAFAPKLATATSAMPDPQIAGSQIFADIDENDWSDATALAAASHDPLLAKIVNWLDLQRLHSGHRFDEIAAFVGANPDWPRRRMLVLRAEDVMDGVPPETLKRWFAVHPPISALARMRRADLMTGDARIAEIRSAWIDGNFMDTDFDQVLSKYADVLRTQDHTARADRLLWSGEAGQAIRMLPLLPPGWRLLVTARLKLANAAAGAPAALARVPVSLQHNGGLLFDRMRWRLAKNDKDGAIAVLEQVTTEQGRADVWWPYRQRLARELLSRGESRRAYHIIAANGLQDGTLMSEAEFTAGWIALRFLNDANEAYPHFVRLHDQSQRAISRARGAYWAARAADAAGNSASAATWYAEAATYTTTYYGQLAADAAGIESPDTPVPEPTATADETARFDATELVQAARLLDRLDQDDLVKTFILAMTAKASERDDFVLLADLAERLGRSDIGVAVAKTAGYANVSLLRAGYPIVPMPRNAGAEQALLLAVTRQESAFDLKAVSRTGALGLMQLEPGTAKRTARDLDMDFSMPRLLSDGYYNVTLGQAYLDGLLARFNGSYVLAIAAYNAGPARVSQWIGQFGDPRLPNVDVIDWVEEIPFGETRDYVQRVLENLQVYRLRIGRRGLAFSLQHDLHR